MEIPALAQYERALQFRAQRNEVLASNIANADVEYIGHIQKSRARRIGRVFLNFFAAWLRTQETERIN